MGEYEFELQYKYCEEKPLSQFFTNILVYEVFFNEKSHITKIEILKKGSFYLCQVIVVE